MPVVAWCCGFLFYTFVGRTAGVDITETGLGTWLIRWWSSQADVLEARLMSMYLSIETKSQILALTLGRRELLSPEIKELYRSAGGSHLLALSGMHLGVMFGILGLALRNSKNGYWHWPLVTISICFVWSYALLTGCPKSLVRAALMMTVALVLSTSCNKRKMIDILTFSASVMILFDPGAVLDVGFQLSCAAMLGISLVAIPVYNGILDSYAWHKIYMSKYGKLKRWLIKIPISSLLVSLSAQIATLPLTLWYFRSIAPYSALTSLVAIPLTTLVIYSSMILYAGGTWIAPLVEWLIGIQNDFMQWVSTLSGAYIVI